MTAARTATAPTARGPVGRGLVVVWALLLALVAVPCTAIAGADAACGHCAEASGGHGMDGQHQGGTCFHCAADLVAGPIPADDRTAGAAVPAAAPSAAAELVAEAPAVHLPLAAPRPPTSPPYLTTRRLRL